MVSFHSQQSSVFSSTYRVSGHRCSKLFHQVILHVLLQLLSSPHTYSRYISLMIHSWKPMNPPISPVPLKRPLQPFLGTIHIKSSIPSRQRSFLPPFFFRMGGSLKESITSRTQYPQPYPLSYTRFVQPVRFHRQQSPRIMMGLRKVKELSAHGLFSISINAGRSHLETHPTLSIQTMHLRLKLIPLGPLTWTSLNKWRFSHFIVRTNTDILTYRDFYPPTHVPHSQSITSWVGFKLQTSVYLQERSRQKRLFSGIEWLNLLENVLTVCFFFFLLPS